MVDPAWDVDAIEKACGGGQAAGGAFVSHCHKDHTNGLPELLSRRRHSGLREREEVEFSEELRSWR